MKEHLSSIINKVGSMFSAEDTASNEQFVRDLDILESLHSPDPDAQLAAEELIRAELDELAGQLGVALLDLNDPKFKELCQLPLKEIETRLGVTKADDDYGRTKYVNVYPHSQKESPEAVCRSEAEYITVTDQLLQEESQTEAEYDQLIRTGTKINS